MLNLQGIFNVEPVASPVARRRNRSPFNISDNQTRYEYDTETGKYFRFKDGKRY